MKAVWYYHLRASDSAGFVWFSYSSRWSWEEAALSKSWIWFCRHTCNPCREEYILPLTAVIRTNVWGNAPEITSCWLITVQEICDQQQCTNTKTEEEHWKIYITPDSLSMSYKEQIWYGFRFWILLVNTLNSLICLWSEAGQIITKNQWKYCKCP